MKYVGKFRAKDDALYTVTITTKKGTDTKNLVLCTSPFVEDLEGSDSSIFKPCKYSSATVRVLTQGASDYMFDIYQSKAQDVSVVLTDENQKVLWTGYVTPNIYDMGFETDKEELEIECQDALSTLQYFKYQVVDTKPKTQTFLTIIRNILRNKTPYKLMYFPSFLEDITLEQLKVSEQNFMDEDGDNWTMQEVLEEICKYLNVTCVASGEEVWFLNYCALNKVEYICYKIPYTTYTVAQMDSTYTVDGESYSENGGKISLLPSYNQISVTSKINEYSDLLPDVFDEKYLTNANGEWGTLLLYNLSGSEIGGNGVFARYKFVTNAHYKTYYYDKETLAPVDIGTTKSYEELQTYIGATLLQVSFEDFQGGAYLSRSSKSLTNYILIHQHDKGGNKLKVFSSVISEMPETFLGDDTVMVVKGSALFMDRENWMYIPTDYSNKKDDFKRENLYLECKLKWGKYYFSNANLPRKGSWTTTETTFKLFFNASDTDHCCNKEFSVLDTSGDYNRTGYPTGYNIAIPSTVRAQGGTPEFEIYTRDRIDSSYRVDAIWLKDFGIELTVPQDVNVKDEDWETDTEYTNVIGEDYVEEGESVECKINTWDSKAPTYSVVVYKKASNKQSYLDTVKNLVSGETYRMEEHIIYDYVNQYKQPSISLELNLKEKLKPYTVVSVPILDEDKKFIVDSYSRDYYSCNNNITLIEKWNL